MKPRAFVRLGSVGATVLAVCLLFGCATKKPAPANYVVFPPPPDEPRIQYLMSFGAESDLGSSGKFSEFVVGKEKVYRPIWKPYGVAISHGKVYVCDTQAGHVTISDLSRHKMRLLQPAGQAAMRIPINIAVDKDGTCYVTDTGRNQVLVYSAAGELIEAVGKSGEMKPCGIALSADRFYVTDLKNHCVRAYKKQSRELLFTFPPEGSDDQTRLFQPTNLTLDQQGRVLVSDSGGYAIKIYDADGKHVRSFGDLGASPGQFTLTKGVGVDHQGRIYVVDAASAVVQLFDAEGRLLMFFGDGKSSGEAGLYLPAGLTIDYDHVGAFQRFVEPGQKLEYLILLTNQAGPHKVSVFGFLKKG